MFQSIGVNERIVIALLIVVLIGTKKLPELFRGVGQAVREFKKAARDTEE